MNRRKLIFFTAADPRTAPGPTWAAYHFASVAAQAGLEAEVRLAGDAVRVAQPGGIADTPDGQRLADKVAASRGAGFDISL